MRNTLNVRLWVWRGPRSGLPARKIACSRFDLVGRHLPRDIPHLLADVVVPSTGGEG
jgi:hypothetical protein